MGLGNAESVWQVTGRQWHPHSGDYEPTFPLLPPLLEGANLFLSFFAHCRGVDQLNSIEYYLRLVRRPLPTGSIP